MLPKRLYLKNFMGHKETDIDCSQFDSCLILGREKGNSRISNAVGKSTIFKAIDYVLFNEFDLKSINKIVRYGQDQCEVVFEFELDSKDWQIIRSRSNKSNKSQVILSYRSGSKWQKSDCRTATQTEKAIADLIKINYKSFTNSVLFAQLSFSEIAEATEGERRKLFKEPLSLAVYSKYEKAAKIKYVEFEKDFNKTRTLIETLGNPINDISLLNDEIFNIEEQIRKLESERKDIKNKISSKRVSFSELEKSLSTDDAKIAETIIDINNQKKNREFVLDSLKEKALHYKNEIEKYNVQFNELTSSLVDNKKNYDLLLNKKVKKETDIIVELDSLDKKIEKGNVYIASVKVNYDRFNKPLPKKAECDVCFNKISDEYREKISKENDIKAQAANNELISAREKLNILLSKKKELNSERNLILEHNQKIRQQESLLSSLENKIENNRNYIKNIEDLSKKLLEEASSEQKNILELKNKEEVLKKKAASFNFDEINKELLNIKHEINELENIENKTITNLNINSTQKGVLDERLRKRKEDSDKLLLLNDSINSQEKNVKLWARVVKAFSTSGIPTLIIHTILDDLQIESNKILQDIRPDLSLQFLIEKEDKDILDIVYKDNGKELEYKQLSGGQKAYVSFALRLGLSLVIQKRLGVNIKFLEFDEVDQPLDLNGKDAFVEIIKKYQKKFKIFVITHDDRLKDKFSHAILVEKDSDGSVGKVVSI